VRIVLDARTATDHFPGIGRYVVSLSAALARLDADMPVTLLHNPVAPSGRLTLPDLPRLPCPVSPFSLSQQWVVPRLLRRAGATIYHSPYYLMPYRPGIPTVLTCYDIIPLLFPHYFSARQRLVFRLAHSLALRAAAVILAISQATRDDLVQRLGVPTSRVHVTPLAADERFRPQPASEIGRVRSSYGLPEHYVLYVGSNKPHKNLVRLVQAWAAVESEARNTYLVVAGHRDRRYPQAEQLAADLTSRVCFIGPVADADLPALYSGARCFVFPSLYEGFGLPVLEAMACGTPVACSNVSSLPEVAGDAALYFDPAAVESVTATLSRLVFDAELRDQIAQAGLRRAAGFSWQHTATLTRAAYCATSFFSG
jgi:glycosyltransferase involved in cell wall biosynthesis